MKFNIRVSPVNSFNKTEMEKLQPLLSEPSTLTQLMAIDVPIYLIGVDETQTPPLLVINHPYEY